MRDYDDRPRRVRRKTPSRRSQTGLILALAGGSVALLALLAAVVAAVVVYSTTTAKSGGPAPANPGFGLTPVPGGAAPAGTAGWTTFTHPEGLYTVKLPVRPAPFGRPDGGSVFAPSKNGFSNSDQFVLATSQVMFRMQVSVLTEAGLKHEMQVDEQFAAQGGRRRQVTWGGRPALEEADILGPGSVRRRMYDGHRVFEFTLTGTRPTDEEKATFFDSFVPGAAK